MNKLNLLTYSLNFFTNFRPGFTNTIFFKKIRTKNRVICRNFIVFILLIKYFTDNSNDSNSNFFKKKSKNINIFNKLNFIKTSVFVKPCKMKLFNILRAPYKNKLSRHQIQLYRYKIKVSFQYNLCDVVTINNTNFLFQFFKKLKNFYIFFESNLMQQHSVKTSFSISYKNNFLF